jgi:hypothetical protein
VISGKTKTFITILFGALLIEAVLSRPALADTWTYTYKGSPFTYFQGYGCPPECYLSGSFTMSAPIPSDLTFAEVYPTSYSLTDGNTTWTNKNTSGPDFWFATDSSGDITSWRVSEIIFVAPNIYMWGSNNPGFGFLWDATEVYPSVGGIVYPYAYSSLPGTWTVTSTTGVPEPGTLFLFATGLAGLAWMLRRRRTR